MKKEDKEKLRKLNEKNRKKAKKVMSEFKAFAVKGNILDLAIGMTIGTAFTKIITSLVNEVIMPAFSTITGKIDYSRLFIAVDGKQYESLDAAKTAGIATINYGTFISNVVDFLIMAIVIFVFMRYIFNKRKNSVETKPVVNRKCPYCLSEIPEEASKCAHCASDVEPIIHKINVKEDNTKSKEEKGI